MEVVVMKTMFRSGALAFEDGETGFDAYLFGDDGNYLRAWFSGDEALDVLRALCKVILPLVRGRSERLKERIKDLQKNLELYKKCNWSTEETEKELNKASSKLNVLTGVQSNLAALEERLEKWFGESGAV